MAENVAVNSFWLGLQVMWRVWTDAAFAGKISAVEEAPPKAAEPPAPLPPGRSEALTLLSVLQREGRLVDFLMEPVDGYSDAQVGAAAREVHKQCAAALHRLFALEPLRQEPEGATVELPAQFDPAEYHVISRTGATSGRGRLVHPGWKAGRTALPAWHGRAAAASVVAACEVEIG